MVCSKAAVPITAGKHVLRLENDGPFPHIDKIALALCSNLPSEPAGVADDSEPLEPVYVANWAKFLTAQKESTGALSRVVEGPDRANRSNRRPPLEAAMLADSPRRKSISRICLNGFRTSTNSRWLIPLHSKQPSTATRGPTSLERRPTRPSQRKSLPSSRC